MDWLENLFFEQTPLQALLVLGLIIAVGLGLGKLRIGGISLGVTFVFFAGILAGHLGLAIDPAMLSYAESFGLVLFVYELGLKVGPGFFSSFRQVASSSTFSPSQSSSSAPSWLSPSRSKAGRT